jgi:hypothetical protein
MADIINLNQARKQRARIEKGARADANRVRFGRTKAEKAADGAERSKTDRLLDDSKRD